MTSTTTRRAALASTVVLTLGAAACSGDGGAERTSSTARATSTAAPATTGAVPTTRSGLRTQMATEGAPTPVASPAAADTPPSKLFAPDNVFRLDVSRAPVDKASPQMVKNLQAQITPHYGGVAGFNTDDYNASYYVADASTPKQDVQFYDCQDKGHVPDGLMNGPEMFRQVPIPAGALPARGTDRSMSVYDRSTDRLWEFWVMERVGGPKPHWRACWGGRIDDVSSAPGYYDPPFGVAASGLAHVGYMVTLEEARRRVIDHAMGIVLLETGDASRIWYPANRSDGNSTAASAIPEGARLRLDPAVDVDALQLSPVGKAIARAAQKYGFIVVDTSGGVAVIAESGQRAAAAQGGKDPWEAVLGGLPNYKVLEGFPWDKVQVVQRDYGKPGR